MNSEITVTEIESAINFWRQKHPSVGEEMRLCEQASALANHYAMMIVSGRNSLAVETLDETARNAYEVWLTERNAASRQDNR